MGALDDIKISPSMMRAMAVKEELNKLFYNEPKRDEEIEMLRYMFEKEEKERLGLHASSITKTGNFCYKEQMINILYKHFVSKGKKPPQAIYKLFKESVRKNNANPIHLQRIYEQGTIMGYKWQMMFIRAGVGVKEDMDISRFVDKYDLSYTPDAIVVLNGRKYVVEIKSQKDNLWEKEKTHHAGIRQLKLYMYFEGIEDGFVLVDNKNTQDFKVLMVNGVDENDKDVEKYLGKLETLQKMKKYALKNKKMPKCDCKKCNK